MPPAAAERSRGPGRAQRVGLELGTVTAGQVITGLAGLLAVRVLTGLLSPTEYGTLSLALSVGILANQVTFGPLSAGLLRFFGSAAEEGDLEQFLRARRRAIGRISIAIVAFTAAAAPLFAILLGATSGALVVLASLFAVATGVESTAASMQTAARRRTTVALLGPVSMVLRYGAGALAVVLVGHSASVALAGYCFGSGAAALLHERVLRRLRPDDSLPGRPSPFRDWDHSLFRYGWPFAIWGAFFWVQLVSDRWALVTFVDRAEAGLYAALFQVGYYPVSQAMAVLNTFLQPIVFRRAGRGDAADRRTVAHRTVSQSILLGFSVCILAVIASVLFGDLLLRLTTAEQYRSVRPLLPLVVASAGIFGVGQLATSVRLSSLRSESLVIPSVLTSAFGAVLTFAFAARWGIDGVVAANLCYSISFTAWMLLLARSERFRG